MNKSFHPDITVFETNHCTCVYAEVTLFCEVDFSLFNDVNVI